MSFLETVIRAKAYLHEQGRVSLRALQREFALDTDAVDELVDELVDVQHVAARDGKILRWVGPGPDPPAATASTLAARQPRETAGERRQLTVLFCDVVDSTRLASRMDPEDWRELLARYQHVAQQAVLRFGGFVAQWLGDGLLVYFGYPEAHEDDAERATRAGLAILDAITEDPSGGAVPDAGALSVRVGIHTGPVVVSAMGEGASRETLATGGTPNIAARLQGEAEPGSVVLSAATLRLVQGVFVTRDLGPRALRGVAEPVRIYQALRSSGVRSRLDVAAADELTRLVGREEELGLLLGRWERMQDGFGQVVVVSGEAGIGKSRMVHALRERLAETPHTWLECGGSSFNQFSAFHPVIELLRRGLALAEDDSPEDKLAKLADALDQNEMHSGEQLSLLASLLSLPRPADMPQPSGTPERQKRLTREALVEWLLRLGRLQPLVLVMEDLHWFDPSTLELVEMIVAQASSEPVMALLTHRPEFDPPWPASPHILRIGVDRLSPRQGSRLVEQVCPGRRLGESVTRDIVERTDGVPLFIEELTRAILDSGDALEGSPPPGHAIPTTLQDLLMARLDRLGPAKELAQLAATVGREFGYPVLRAVSTLDESALRAALARLVEAGLLYQRGTVPDASFVFKHALIQETAYRSLLRPQRRRFHQRIAEALEAHFPETAEERPERLAYHLSGAGLDGQAIGYWQNAGQRAVQRSANVEAVRHLSQALEALGTNPPGPERDTHELGIRTLLGLSLIATEGYSAPQVLRNFDQARQLCEARGDTTPTLFPVLQGLFRFYLVRSDREATARMVEQCLRLAGRSEEPSHRFFAELAAGMRAFYAGEHLKSRETLARVQSLYDPAQREAYTLAYGQDPAVSAQNHAAWNEWYLGFPDRARELALRALERAQGEDQAFARAGGFVSASRLWRLRGEAQTALEHAEAAIRISEDQGFSTWLWAARLCRGTAVGLLGRTEDALEEVRTTTQKLLEIGNELFAPNAFCELASLSLRTGRVAEAHAALRQARELVERNLDVYEEAEVERLRGEAALCSGDPAEALACFDAALELSRRRQTRSLELRAAISRAELFSARGSIAEAREPLEKVYQTFSEGFETRDLQRARALLEGLG